MLIADIDALAAHKYLLLDTAVWGHVMLGESAILTTGLLAAIERSAHDQRLLVSAASVWEIARQVECGALMIDDLPGLISNQQRPPGVNILPLSTDILLEAHMLPPFDHHRDPAARFIAATARRTGAAILTVDPSLIAMASAGTIHAYNPAQS
jgi:PIN domain nuclease of toxin-antitoxin system